MSEPKITNEEEALEVLKQIGEELKHGGSVEEELTEALRHLPGKLLTTDLYLEAVKQNGLTLAGVPLKLRTAELCLQAVKQDGRALQYVPWGQINLSVPAKAELCLEAVKQDGRALQYVPEELRTAEVCFEAVRRDGRVLGFVPENLITVELCIEALAECGIAPFYGPEELQKKVHERITALANAYKHETD